MARLSDSARRRPSSILAVAFLGIAGALTVSMLATAQVETVGNPGSPTWVSHGRAEGRLTLRESSAGAFSPDSSALAVVGEDKIVLMDLRRASVRKILRPRVEGVSGLDIRSADFLDENRIFLRASGFVQTKGKGPLASTPELALQWDTQRDALVGKVNAVGVGGRFSPVRYLPDIRYLALYKDSSFTLWNPTTGQGPRVDITALNRAPHLYTFSRDGRWLLVAQIEGSATADPSVVQLSERRFVDSLPGHQGTVLGLAFSRDSKRVLTACEDGKVRIWSVPEWKLLQTLTGHEGPVHWAEFSSNGKWVVSAGEDSTGRIWSAEDGKAEQILRESKDPLLTVAFSPNDEYIAASSEQAVLVWQRGR